MFSHGRIGSRFGIWFAAEALACESSRKAEGIPGIVFRLACCYRTSLDSSNLKPVSARDTYYGKLNKLSFFDQV